ncbi:unnamed protein product, partial [Didymodactylos carnosus]
EFAIHASKIIDLCFDEDEQFATELLTTKSRLYFNYNPLQLAEENHCRSFLATKTVQKHLDLQWYGEIDDYGNDKTFISLVVILN